MDGKDKSGRIVEVMSRSGMRITDQRKTLADIFAQTDGYLSPKDVYDKMREKYPGVSFDTVYRNLRMLSEMGALEQFYFLEGGLKFKASCLSQHHHHLICTNCEKTIALDFCPMEQPPLHLPGRFKIMNHRFEVYGICEACQQHPAAET